MDSAASLYTWKSCSSVGISPARRRASPSAASLDRARGAEALRAVLSSRGGLAPDAFELRVVSVLVVEALTAALEAWLEGGGEADLLALTGQALDVVEAGAGAVLSPSRP